LEKICEGAALLAGLSGQRTQRHLGALTLKVAVFKQNLPVFVVLSKNLSGKLAHRRIARLWGEAGMPKMGGRSSMTVLSGYRVTPELLRRLHVLHRRYIRGMRDGRRAVLKDCNLSDLVITAHDFSDSEFIACNFKGAVLVDTHFERANLFGCSFTQADLTRANFSRADLRGAKFDEAILTHTVFKEADLRRGEVIGTEGKLLSAQPETSFKAAQLERTELSGSRLGGADFAAARLKGVSFQNADMRYCSFKGAEMNEVVLQGANLIDADLRQAALDEATEQSTSLMRAQRARPGPSADDLPDILKAHFAWAQSGGKTGARADFSQMDMSGRYLGKAVLAGAVLRGTVLTDADLSNAVLAACDLRDAVLLRTDLRGADLRGADLRGAHLANALLDDVLQGRIGEAGLATRA
jgi:uncharacterized protein YjbI with pentapeptide repeats